MKLITSLFFTIALLVVSCKEPAVQFEEPQPADVKSLAAIPGKLLGNYTNENDSIKLFITNTLIIRQYTIPDSTGQYFNDTILDLGVGKIKKFKGYYFVSSIVKRQLGSNENQT